MAGENNPEGGLPPSAAQEAEDDRLLALYNKELMACSARTAMPRLLPPPCLHGHAVSPICGSEVDVYLTLSQEGRVADFGYAVDACALTRAVVAVMDEVIRGKNGAEIAKAGENLRSFLNGGLKILPSGEWGKLALLEPVREYSARHNAILLPFEAVARAFEAAGACQL